MIDVPRLILWACFATAGFLVGRIARNLSRPRCPELRAIKAYVGWDDDKDRRVYKVVRGRCELKDLHEGPCVITESVDNPVYWNPEDAPEYATPTPPRDL